MGGGGGWGWTVFVFDFALLTNPLSENLKQSIDYSSSPLIIAAVHYFMFLDGLFYSWRFEQDHDIQ